MRPDLNFRSWMMVVGKTELGDAQKAGSNYDMFAAPATKKVNPVGEWNTCTPDL